MNRFKQFMVGRYGNDALNIAIMLFGCALTFILSLLRVRYYSLISLIPYAFAVYRMMSKDFSKRSKENVKFLELSAPWRAYAKKKFSQFQDKEHRYYNCPQCHQTLRVPKGRGKIKITCPYCSREFKKKT